MNQTKGFLSLITTAFILGTFGVLIRLLSEYFSDPGQVFARSIAASGIIIIIIMAIRVNPFQINKKNLKYILIFSIVFPLSLLCLTFSVNLTKVTNSIFMLYVGSLASTAILGRILFKEKFTPKHILSLGLVITGLLFFVYPFGKDSLTLGILFGLIAGILEGSSHVLRKLMKDVKREIIVFYQNCSTVIVATIFLLVSTEPFIRQFSIEGIIIAVIFGALLVVIGYLLVYGFQNFDVNWGTIILATEVFFATVINAVFLKEIPTTLEVIGGLLIFSGTIVTSLKLGQKNKTKV